MSAAAGLPAALAARIAAVTGQAVRAARPLSGGSVGTVLLLTLDDGSRRVAKLGPGLEPEAWMLRFLAERTALPVPALEDGDDALLLMAHVATSGGLDDAAQADAARALAALHAITAPAYGLERDTVIGGLAQVNTPDSDWVAFYRDRRLGNMARRAHAAGRLPAGLLRRIERLGARLDRILDPPERPGLVHGDAWGGNILCRGGKVAAFIDPALYFADPEMDLAFGTLFGSFGPAFFAEYHRLRPIRPGFWEERKDLYLLWPLLVHVRLFGASYLDPVERIVARWE
jgi:fructosamine-3-kinase